MVRKILIGQDSDTGKIINGLPKDPKAQLKSQEIGKG